MSEEHADIASVNNNRASAQELGVVKEEKTYRDLRVTDNRKYGDRHLLVRGTGGNTEWLAAISDQDDKKNMPNKNIPDGLDKGMGSSWAALFCVVSETWLHRLL